ncbi:MAG: hypothetical protein CMJ47_06460 [Planctomyces sp.]|nr:hypothetical protein [Planctomyces sp.]
MTRARIGQVVGKLQERWAKDPALTRLRTDLTEVLAGQGGVMSPRELREAVLVARGSSQDEPLRTKLAHAVIRAAVEVERTRSEPRFLVRRDEDNVVIARNADLANYVRRLGEEADKIAAEDPLLAPARVIVRLQDVPAPAGVSIPEARLVRMAAEFSHRTAVSSRQELYPRDMDIIRAVKLSQGALLGQKELTVEQIQERVAGRYPEASELPSRPALDGLLEQAGFDLRWNPEGKNGTGCYVRSSNNPYSVTSASKTSTRSHSSSVAQPGEITPELSDARHFDERLQRSLKEGAFLSLLVNPRKYNEARNLLSERYPLQLVDLEGLLLKALREAADQANVDWNLVLQTDAQPNQGDWDKLMLLVSRAMPAVKQQLFSADKTMLLVYPGLLARYGQMDLLSELSQKVGRADGIPGLWLLIPGDHQAMVDGKPVPLIGPGQRTRIPDNWLSGFPSQQKL